MRINYLENKKRIVGSFKLYVSLVHYNCYLLILSFTANDIYRPSVHFPQYFQAYEV